MNIREAYTTNQYGLIALPGKFEGEPIFAPMLWDLALQGCADEDDGRDFVFRFQKGDPILQEWPELKAWLGRKRSIRLREDEQGFVRCH